MRRRTIKSINQTVLIPNEYGHEDEEQDNDGAEDGNDHHLDGTRLHEEVNVLESSHDVIAPLFMPQAPCLYQLRHLNYNM